jgi:predicted deacylase
MSFKEFFKNRNYESFIDELSQICKNNNYQLKTIGKVEKYDVYSVIVNPKEKQTLCITGGIHGDEPAGSLGILQYLKNSDKPNMRLFIIPLLNPWGFEHNSRNNQNHKNLNREFNKKNPSDEAKLVITALLKEKPFFLHNIHEDDTQNGFYLYYSDKKSKEKYKKILEIARKFFPINVNKKIHDDDANQGMIYVSKNDKNYSNVASLECFAYQHNAQYLCSETPGGEPLDKRVKCNQKIIEFVANSF